MFVIPFIFALYPEILLIDDAVIDAAASASGAVVYITGYDGTVDVPGLMLVIGRLILALYLVSSALARFDRRQLGVGEVALRIALAIGLMMRYEFVYIGAGAAALALIAFHTTRRSAAA